MSKKYGDEHRLFVQAMLSASVLSEIEAEETFKRCFHSANVEDVPEFANDFKPFITLVNKELQPINLVIKQVTSEANGRKFWGIKNTHSDEMAVKEASDLSKMQIELFTWIIKQIVEVSSDGLVDEFAIINQSETENHKSHTKSGNEELVARLVEDRWLVKLGSGGEQIGLGIRSQLELADYIKGMYPDDCKDCELCRGTTFMSVDCADASCSKKYCQSCLRQLWDKQKSATKKCPACKTTMDVSRTVQTAVRFAGNDDEAGPADEGEDDSNDDNAHDGEDDDDDDDDDNGGPATGGGGGGGRAARSSSRSAAGSAGSGSSSRSAGKRSRAADPEPTTRRSRRKP